MLFNWIITDSIRNLLFEIFLAIGILLFGILFGNLISHLLLKIVKAVNINKKIPNSFIKLIITVIRWSIYITFLIISLTKFSVPILGDFITRILVVIPALTGALILISIGFAIAIYLKRIIKDSEIVEWKTLSTYIYYFVLYVFGVYALNLALISIDSLFKNILITLLTTIVGVSVASIFVKKHLTKLQH